MPGRLGRVAVPPAAVIVPVPPLGTRLRTLGGHLIRRQVAVVGAARGQQLARDLGMARRPVGLEHGLAVAGQVQPVQALDDALGRRIGAAFAIGVLDAQQEFAAVVAAEQVVEQRGAHPADVQRPVGLGAKRVRTPGGSFAMPRHVARPFTGCRGVRRYPASHERGGASGGGLDFSPSRLREGPGEGLAGRTHPLPNSLPQAGGGDVNRLAALVAAERDRAVLWLPVFMGAGVLAYFDLRFEPPVWAGPAIVLPVLLLAIALRRFGWQRGVASALAACAIGFAAAQFATARAPPPDTTLPTHATQVTGMVRSVEALPDSRRVMLEAVRLDDSPTPLARFLRIRLRRNDDVMLGTGDTLRVRALVRAPGPPSYPGGWDLQRDAFYAGLGGSGFALGQAEVLSKGVPAAPLRLVQRLREIIADRVSAAIPGSAGAFAVTLLTGFQNAMPLADHDAFRAAGLAHLLAVAGLHIGVVMGFAMVLARTAFAASEHASLFWPTKQLAAVVALSAGLCYALLTGLHLPVQRSFLMASLFTLAVLAGRRAISLRGLAVAATALMLAEPQEVPGVSFR